MMKGSLQQRIPGSWETTVDLGHLPLGKRKRKVVTMHGTYAQIR